jgi:hypothetical protein
VESIDPPGCLVFKSGQFSESSLSFGISYRVFLMRAIAEQIDVQRKRLKWSLIVIEKHG